MSMAGSQQTPREVTRSLSNVATGDTLTLTLSEPVNSEINAEVIDLDPQAEWAEDLPMREDMMLKLSTGEYQDTAEKITHRNANLE